MCRSVSEGGRRCNHGNESELRQQRRVNARLRETFSGDVTPRSTLADVSVTAAGSFEHVYERVMRVKEGLLGLDDVDAYGGEVTVNGEVFPTVSIARKVLTERLEVEVRNLGAAIDGEVAERVGFKPAEIGEYVSSRKAELEAELDRLKTAAESLRVGAVKRFGLPDFCTFDAVRHKVHDNPDDAEMVHLLKEHEDLEALLQSAKSEYYAVIGSTHEKVKTMWAESREALVSILGEKRKLGGVELIVDDASDKRKVKALENVLNVYPSEWIEASNANETILKVKKTVGRAHYNKNSRDMKIVPVERFVIKDADFQPDGSRHESDWVQLQPNEDGEIVYVDEGRGINFRQFTVGSESIWLKPVYEYASPYSLGSDGKPYGRGWVQAEVMEHVDGEMKPVTVWRRQAKQKREVGKVKADLLVDGAKGSLVPDEGYDSAVHEFAHRVEDSNVPLMKNLQDAFYRRRTVVDGVALDEIRLYKGRNEFAVPDSFTADYMGKRYPESQHFEILSTGMEAIFGNSYGGLVGMGKNKPDLDMRHFIIGMLASV